jgi:lipopolysaccharide export system permease protein
MKPKIFNFYVIKNISIATAFVAVTLAAIIMMTQSIKFLELIIDSGASSGAFWALVFMALPRFFEVILPIALMIGGIFVYHRMISDSEMIVMRSAGSSPLQTVKPALIVGLMVSLLMFFISAWLAPVSLAKMQKMRQVVKAQYSTLLFQDGVFNEVGKYLTVYIDGRNSKGELEGLLIHDSRPTNPVPVTIVAKRGVVVATDTGQQVLVYDGSRQDFNKRNGALNRLDFERYSIDLPDTSVVGKRWKEPDERTFSELIYPEKTETLDKKNKYEFMVEAHRRMAGVLLPLTFISVALCFLLLGPLNRKGQGIRVMMAVISVVILQSLFLSSASLATQSIIGIVLLYLVVLLPLVFALFVLSPFAEVFRQEILYRYRSKTQVNHKKVGAS